MRVFEIGKEWDERLNIVDDNNVLVGFDLAQNCCENFCYMILDTEPETIQQLHEATGIPDTETVFPGFVFDTDYFRDLTSEDDCGDTDAAVVFRAVHPDNRVLYIALMNTHNGYYSHGFSMEVGGQTIHGGSL